MPLGTAASLVIHEHPSRPGEIGERLRTVDPDAYGPTHVIPSDHPRFDDLVDEAHQLGAAITLYLFHSDQARLRTTQLINGVERVIHPSHVALQAPSELVDTYSQVPVPMILADHKGFISYMNHQARQFFYDILPGSHASELAFSKAFLGRNIIEKRVLEQILEAGQVKTGEDIWHFEGSSDSYLKIWKQELLGNLWTAISLGNDLTHRPTASIQSFVRQYARFFYDKVFLLDGERNIAWCSESARDTFNLEPENQTILMDELIHSEDLKNIKLGEMFESMINRRFELRMKSPDGSYRWYEVVSHSFNEQDGANGMVILLRNIHQRKTAEWALLQSERKFKGLFNNVMHAISIFQGDKLVLANQKFFDTLGRKLIGTFSINDFLPSIDPADRSRLLRTIANFRQSDQEHLQDIPLKILKPSGQHIFTTNTIAKVDFEGDKALLIVTNDDTDKVKSRRETMLQRIEAQDHERKRLAHDLHDGLGQTLSALGMYLNTMKVNYLQDTSDQGRKQEFGEIEKLLQQAIGETRSISYNLMPNTLKQFGLVEALEESVRRINYLESGLMINFKHALKTTRLAEDVELSVFRIIQEIITNTIKHSEASVLILEVLERNGTLLLTSVDNGKGFNLDERMSKGVGLGSIQDRLEVLHASLEIESKIGFGTSYRIMIPIASKSRNL